MDTIVSMISTMGFPIAMCLVLMWYVYMKDKQHSDDLKKLTDAVNTQNSSIVKLCERIDRLFKRGDSNAK